MSKEGATGYSAIEVEAANGAEEATEDQKIQQLKQHVSEVSNIMQENINKILERGTRLDHIENRSDLLSSRADDFRTTARRVQRKMWWKNARMNILIFIGIALVGLAVFYYFFRNQS